MGQFSWVTADTKEPIYSDFDKQKVHVLIPEKFGGGHIIEEDYQGYGVFGGCDIYELLALWNATSMCKFDGDYLIKSSGHSGHTDFNRSIGIDIGCYDNQMRQLKYPLKITVEPMKYEDCVDISISEGANQGWHTYEEDYEEEDYND